MTGERRHCTILLAGVLSFDLPDEAPCASRGLLGLSDGL
jgi:hypothetical protein